jgi:hypothetical protein
MKPLTVHYVPSCAFSAGTIAFLVARGADFSLVNLDEHPDVRKRLTSRLAGKKLETPALEIDGEVHVAPQLSELKKMLASSGLPDDAAPHTKIKKAKAA